MTYAPPESRFGQSLLVLSVCTLIFLGWRFLPHPLLGLAIGFVPLAMLGVLAMPFMVVLAFVVFSFFRIHEAFPALYSLRIPQLLALASLAVLVWHVGLTQKVKPFFTPELNWLLIFFGLVTVGVMLAANRPVAMNYYTGIFIKMVLMTLAIAWMTRTPSDFAWATRFFALAGVAIALVALDNQAKDIGMVEGTRVTIGRDIGSMLGDPNDLALVLLFPFAFALSLLLGRGQAKLMRLFGAISTVLIFMAIIATQSRGGLLGIMTVTGVFAWSRVKNKAVLGGVAVVVALGLFAMAGITDRSSGGAAEDGIDESAMGRIYAWGAAWNMALKNPLTGVGIDNFYANYFFFSSHWDGKNHAVHSTWFGVLAETGFVGLAVFITWISYLVRRARSHWEWIRQQAEAPIAVIAASEAMLAGLAGTIISGTFLTQGFTWPFYILAALIAAMSGYRLRNEAV